MNTGSPVDIKLLNCPYCDSNLASYPRGDGQYYCYKCQHPYDVDDEAIEDD